MTNLREVEFDRLEEDEGAPMPWRSVGAIASGWAERLEAQRAEAGRIDALHFVPVAWAAE